MKRKSFIAALLLLVAGVQTAWAQSVIVNMKDEGTSVFNLSDVESISFSESDFAGGFEYVDLDLPSGTLWATCNVGAESPEEFGDYFAWGETNRKWEYSWAMYQYIIGDNPNALTRYCNQSEYGYQGLMDGITELLQEDDAATAYWGNKWQTPDVNQFKELFNEKYTTSEWTTLNGKNVRKITSKSNGMSIVLPAAGYREDTGIHFSENYGYYWSRSLGTNDPTTAFLLFFNSDEVTTYGSFRYLGLSVRPVCVKKKMREHEYVDLGLPSGTLWATTNIGADSPEEYGDYFAWGETEPKDEYNWSTYKYCENGNSLMTTKYRVNSPGGTIDNKTVLDPEDDAATVNWGLDWQMPSQEQLKELFNGSFTSSVNTTLNNVEGVLVTSLTNGNSIFLPKAGRYNGVNYYADGGSFWSRNLDLSDSYDRKALHTWVSDAVNYGPYERYQGLSIRPVRRQEVQGHEYVDLGLPSGTLWATTNIGADSPEDYGDYFAWGETKPKDEYNWSTYFDTKDYGRTFEKYNTDGKTKLLPEDDAATANWGDDWQMPTYDQMRELVNSSYTTSEWTTVNGVEGRKITSRSNGKSIFLPAEGICHERGLLYAGSYGLYWSRSLLTDNSSQAHYLDFNSDDFREDMNFCNRDYGQCIRPVVKY